MKFHTWGTDAPVHDLSTVGPTFPPFFQAQLAGISTSTYGEAGSRQPKKR